MGRGNLPQFDANRGHGPLNWVGRHSVEPTLPTQEARAIASISACRGGRGKIARFARLAALECRLDGVESLPTGRPSGLLAGQRMDHPAAIDPGDKAAA